MTCGSNHIFFHLRNYLVYVEYRIPATKHIHTEFFNLIFIRNNSITISSLVCIIDPSSRQSVYTGHYNHSCFFLCPSIPPSVLEKIRPQKYQVKYQVRCPLKYCPQKYQVKYQVLYKIPSFI